MIVKEQDLTGKNLSNYKILGKLGKGGMATVYKAHELSLNRVVALKVLSPRLSEDTEFIKRFQREAQAAAKLNHPNIMQIYAIGEEKGIHYFAMEYIKGKTLAHLKKEEGTLTAARAIPIIKQVAKALGEAHKVGLVHRDIKPSNIMIDASGRAKVTDFGIAYVAEAKTKLTREGSIIGTPEYLSPEQCEGKPLDGRSDIYSLGVTLYEMLSGKTPYEADTPVSMLMKIVQGNFLPLHQVNPNVPLPVQNMVEKMMQTDTQKRYANVDELLESLREVEKEIALSESKAAVKDTVSRIEPEPVGVRQPVEQHFQEQKKRSNLWPAVTVALIIVLLLGGAFAAKVFYFDKRSSPGESSEKTQSQDITPGSNESSLSLKNGSIETTTDPVELSDPSEAGDQTGIQSIEPETTTASGDQSKLPDAEDQTGVQGMESASSTQQTVSAVKPTTTSSTTSTTSKRPIVKKPRPPAKSLIVTTLGGDDKEDIITSYVQSVFSRANFTIMDGPSMGNKNLSDIARYHLVVTVNLLGTTTLNYYGSSSEQYTVGLTMKAVATQSGKIIAGPLTATVKYTTLNAEENLKKAAVRLASRLQKTLEN
jgi:serine/threonine protein kinase